MGMFAHHLAFEIESRSRPLIRFCEIFFEGFRPPASHDELKGALKMKMPNSARSLSFIVILVLQCSILSSRSRGAAGDVDPSFDPGSGIDGKVQAVALQP